MYLEKAGSCWPGSIALQQWGKKLTHQVIWEGWCWAGHSAESCTWLQQPGAVAGDTFCHHREEENECSPSGQSHQNFYSSWLHQSGWVLDKPWRSFQGSAECQVSTEQVRLPLCSPTGRQCCTYIIPMKGLKHLHFNPGEFMCMCPHLCWQEKQPHLIPETYLIGLCHVSHLCRSGKR